MAGIGIGRRSRCDAVTGTEDGAEDLDPSDADSTEGTGSTEPVTSEDTAPKGAQATA